jgi:hypothetical protein
MKIINNKKGEMSDLFKWLLWAIFAVIIILALYYLFKKVGVA